ncbi:MAG: toll/interleukin-1 receptor domain-containing protein, partial [Vicinamibacteria bacterium]
MFRRLDEESVVPVVGPDLLTVDDGGRETFLYPLLAKRLAEYLHVSAAELPEGFELEEVSRRYLMKSDEVQEIYRSLRLVFRDLDPISIPTPLVQLAKIPRLKLFATTTFDVLTERALDQERFEGQRQTLAFAYAPNDKQDLPPELDRLNRPAVFHLMGRLSGTPHSYAVTRDDTLEFLSSLQSKTEDSPGFLLDRLRSSDLLILGSRLVGWLARLCNPSARTESLDGNPVVLVGHLGGGTEVWREGSAVDFVNELYRRWTERKPAEEPDPELASARVIPVGSVFLSCARGDRSAAESLRDELDRAGVDVVLDVDDVPLSERWEKELRSVVAECALFVPVISARSLTAQRRFFRGEWVGAIREAGKAVPAGRFVLPVVIDDTSKEPSAIPEEFGELPWERIPGGKPSSEFVKRVVQLQ